MGKTAPVENAEQSDWKVSDASIVTDAVLYRAHNVNDNRRRPHQLKITQKCSTFIQMHEQSYDGNEREKRKVSTRFRKTARVGADVTSRGRLF